MLVSPEYCRMMARYNAWQNKDLRQIIETMPAIEINRERGAFFGSIRKTLNHLLWADLVWMSRLEGGEGPAGGMAESTRITLTAAEWAAERFRCDGRIVLWADGLTAVSLTGTLRYRARVQNFTLEKPMGQAVAHFFNHQTHHRGQIHAMLTAAGAHPGDTDLILMDDIG